MPDADVAIVGGGIVGLATAYNLMRRHPDTTILVIEKEPDVGAHQTGHNSGVLHSGIYYRPGSLKALNCRTGKQAMEAFCAEQGIAYEICGKVIVAVDENEIPALERIFERGQQNGVRCEMISAERLRKLEPHARGVRAVHVPEAGIVNFRQVCRRLAELVSQSGHRVLTDTRLLSLQRERDAIVLGTTQGNFSASYLVNCGGLYSDRIAAFSGITPETKILPFRGEYYLLKPEARYLVRNLIYPVPDPNFPFLGVHFTRMIDGQIECGPNAVLALAREGYRKTDVNLRDLCEALTYRGFLRLARRYWRVGLGEMWRSLSKRAFVRALKRLIPEIREEHLVAARAGVRAQGVTRDGQLVDDFIIQQTDRMIHVESAPSPAATSALNIGNLIVQRWESMGNRQSPVTGH